MLVVLALAVAFAWPMQVQGFNQNAHYALVKALSNGQPYIDGVIGEVGDLSTGDTATFEGHLYAVKAPGLAFASLPAYLGVEALGMRTTGDPMRALWVLHLAGTVLPAVVLIILVLAFGERIQPGFGVPAAVMLGLATLMLPFATLFFAHMLSAMLGFAAFYVLWRERSRPARLGWSAVAGLLAGLALTVEYQYWLLAAILAAYAAAGAARLRRVLAYGAGLAAGLVPVLAFHVWAYGNPLHTPYEDYWVDRGASGRHFTTLPSADRAGDFLFSSMGLLVLCPVLVCGLVGAVLLHRRGSRAEALVLVGSTLAYGLYFSRLGAFGGLGPPRYLVAIVPFAAAGLAVALRALPLTTIALAAISAFQLIVMTATGPLAAYDGSWLERLTDGDVMETATVFVGVTGWYAILPFFAAAGLAVGAALAGWTPPAIVLREGWLAIGAVLAWAALALRAPNDFGAAPSERYVLAVVVALSALIVVVLLRTRSRGVPRMQAA
jgi:hypothetical protein